MKAFRPEAAESPEPVSAASTVVPPV